MTNERANEDSREVMRCTGQLFGRCDGWMQPWRGGDGHGGTETFYTCDRCGRTW